MMKVKTGVRAYAHGRLTPAAVAGLAGLMVAPAALADDAPHEVRGVEVEGHFAAEPASPNSRPIS